MLSSKGQVIGWWWTKKVVLNAATNGDSADVRSTADVINQIRAEILKLKGGYFSANGLSVNYKEMGRSDALAHYEQTVSLLRSIDLTNTSETERRSFFVNTYNSLVIHGLARGHLAEGSYLATLERLKFYASVSYAIGDHVYSLNEVENGILRGNKPSPVPMTSPMFALGDPRLAFVVPCDPRIHFALNCGAKSCPPIGIYSSEPAAFERQLTLATEVFLDSTVTVDPTRRTVRLSKIFDWYKGDFGATDREVLQWIHEHATAGLAAKIVPLLEASGDKLVIEYEPYDWDLNS